jgi:hypothetical protein
MLFRTLGLLLFVAACSQNVEPAPKRDVRPATTKEVAKSPVVDLGKSAAGALLSFDVPAGTLGFSIVVEASVTADDFVGVLELRDPGGAVVIEDSQAIKRPGRMTTGMSGAGVGVVRMPLSDDDAETPIPSGRWTVVLGGARRVPGAPKGTTTPWTGELSAKVAFQTSRDGTFHGGELDLDVYVPEGLRVYGASPETIDATSAPTSVALEERLAGAFALLDRLYGIGRGEVRFHGVASSVAAIESQEEIDAANRLATDPRPSAKIVLTNRLAPEREGEISGIVNAIPGAILVPGTSASAVILSLREGMEVWEDASTLVHEIGHFVGLSHTSELGIDRYDDLADTPTCDSTDKKGLASCPDRDNIMFATMNLASGEDRIWASPIQTALFRSSPLYRAK